ncbi:MarR family EPS-associated transcriptional regulator [Pelagibacteraceae bacterium]|nr:MarR family EPS-associated transcriptional regulator [Pelagibacteraceae bacterium]
MKNFDNETDNFKVLRKLDKKPSITQRELSDKLGISLGKINYCLKELRKKGLIKISNFQKNKNKINYAYLLTPKGITAKTRLTINFMKIKLKEYEDLKKDMK